MTVRPHMAGILAIAFFFPYLFGANRTGMSGLALKVLGIPALVALTWVFVCELRPTLRWGFSPKASRPSCRLRRTTRAWVLQLMASRWVRGWRWRHSTHPALPVRSS